MFPSSLRSDNFPCYFEAILPARFSRDTIAIKRNGACSRFIPDRDQRETLSRKRLFRWLANVQRRNVRVEKETQKKQHYRFQFYTSVSSDCFSDYRLRLKFQILFRLHFIRLNDYALSRNWNNCKRQTYILTLTFNYATLVASMEQIIDCFSLWI